jgi:hypothetical protein
MSPRPPFPAVLLAAAGVLVALVVLRLLPVLATLSSYPGDPRYVVLIVGSQAGQLFVGPLLVAVTVLVAFAWLAPIRGGLRMAEVVRRGVVSAVIAVAVSALVAAVVGVVALAGAAGPRLLSLSLAEILRYGGPIRSTLLGGLLNGFDALLAVPLAALLLWGWMRRTPRPQAPAPPIPPHV